MIPNHGPIDNEIYESSPFFHEKTRSKTDSGSQQFRRRSCRRLRIEDYRASPRRYLRPGL